MMPSPDDLITPTPPEACALALALPITHADFMADLGAGPTMDYASGMARGRVASVAWEQDGKPLAQVCRELLDTASEYGVSVNPAAKLGDLPELFETNQVLTLFAHWRGAEYTRSDLLSEPELIVSDIRKTDTPLSRALKTKMTAAEIDPILTQGDLARRKSAFAEFLNTAVIDSEIALPGCISRQPGVITMIDDLTLRSRHRSCLDKAFPDYFRPGNQIELRDGLHSPEALATCIPEGWRGILDLAICNSSYAAHIIKSGLSTRRIVTNNNKVVPGIRLRIQKHLYGSLVAGDRNYATELIGLYRELRGALR